MNRLKKPRPFVLAACLAVGLAFLLIYSFASAAGNDSDDSAGRINRPAKSVKNQASAVARAIEDGAAQSALSAGETDGELYAASRGDEYRSFGGNTESGPAAKSDATATAVKSDATATAPAPAKPAAPKPAPAPAKAPVQAAKPAAAPKPAPAPAKPSSGYQYDLDLLARLITAEAQGEPYEAQVAVGAVVMNRVKSSDWPNTVKGVIYQEIGGYYQFTPVVNGWINKPAEPEGIRAAKEAMSGADPTNGAQFYYDDKVTNQWILAKPVSAQYGHMIFAF
jgi:spore germination cell wall hydrolase CwlJ-like protein